MEHGPVPVGYEHLRRFYGLKATPHFRTTFTTNRWDKQLTRQGTTEEHLLPASFHPSDSLGGHLEFALKYEGLNLSLLAELYLVAAQAEVVAAVTEKRTGQYRRKIWFLYEMLTGELLPIPDLNIGAYVPSLKKDFV